MNRLIILQADQKKIDWKKYLEFLFCGEKWSVICARYTYTLRTVALRLFQGLFNVDSVPGNKYLLTHVWRYTD
jgi:hypothetical protein